MLINQILVVISGETVNTQLFRLTFIHLEICGLLRQVYMRQIKMIRVHLAENLDNDRNLTFSYFQSKCSDLSISVHY